MPDEICMNSNQSSKNVMIIGGGVAGMAAAKTLNDHQVKVHIVEKQDRFGGHASNWACMATDSCENCSACLSLEMAAQVPGFEHVTAYLESQVAGVEKIDGKYRAVIEGENADQIEIDDIIVATGFSPAVPPGLLGDTWRSSARVITTAELNQLLRNQSLEDLFSEKSNPVKVGFVQCVGSRNRELGKDYCSQVCCQISMRHVNKLLHLYPDADISLFYIDLQAIGKETRSFFNTVSDRVSLLQGVPFEVFDDKQEGKISVISEDTINGGRSLSHFDLLVLSVGMHENETIKTLAGDLGVSLDSYGFLTDPEKLGSENIWAAGCAAGPMDIQKAKHQGITCANQIIEKTPANIDPARTVAIVGDSDAAKILSGRLYDKGFSVSMLGMGQDKKIEQEGVRYLPGVQLYSITGTANQFDVLYSADGKTCKDNVLAVVAADPVQRTPAGSRLGLTEDKRFTLGQFLEKSESSPKDIPDRIVFWLDYSGPEIKSSARQVLVESIRLAKLDKKVSIIMNKMLVHGLDGQRMYDQARQLGVRFLKVEHPGDVRVETKNGQVRFLVKEKILGDIELSFSCDCVVIPEKISPSTATPRIATVLKEPLDIEGWLQSSNVRHRLVNSPKKGLFYLGNCHNETAREDLETEIGLITGSIVEIAENLKSGSQFDIEINSIKCKKCLTCYRTCPHGAIVIEGKTPRIIPESCYGCGLCLSSCPALAIESSLVSDDRMLEPVSEEACTVFACERSGAIAAASMESRENVSIQTVSCVCRMGENVLLKALEKGGRVVLAGCHENNCQSVKGSRKADTRVGWIKKLPGILQENISWLPVAANESKKLEQFLTQNVLTGKNS